MHAQHRHGVSARLDGFVKHVDSISVLLRGDAIAKANFLERTNHAITNLATELATLNFFVVSNPGARQRHNDGLPRSNVRCTTDNLP